jgi:hypothetical protein
MKYKEGDIVKVKMIIKGVRWPIQQRSDIYFMGKYFMGKIGIVEYTGNKGYIHNDLCIIKFYFGKTDTKGIIKETFHIDELGEPSKKEMKKFQSFLEKINAKELAEKL